MYTTGYTAPPTSAAWPAATHAPPSSTAAKLLCTAVPASASPGGLSWDGEKDLPASGV